MNKQIQLFEKQAKRYSQRSKKKSGDFKLRQKLLRSAKGDILEVSVGAGTNFQFYPKNSNITAVDFSPSMIEKAKGAAREHGLEVDFIVSNVEDLTLPHKSYDTVASTLSLCSYPNPEKVLSMLASWCKEDGQILLLEHGISSNGVFSWLQNRLDSYYKKKIGCHLNRDIIKMVKDAPITIRKHECVMFDSVHLIWATPNSEEGV